jgi:hypothetical protein
VWWLAWIVVEEVAKFESIKLVEFKIDSVGYARNGARRKRVEALDTRL